MRMRVRALKTLRRLSAWGMCFLLTGCLALGVRETSGAAGPPPTIAAIFQKKTAVPVNTSDEFIDALVGVVWGDEQISASDSEAPVHASSSDTLAIGGTDAATQLSQSGEGTALHNTDISHSDAGTNGEVVDAVQPSPALREFVGDPPSGDGERQGRAPGATRTSDEAHTASMPERVANQDSTPVALPDNEVQQLAHNTIAGLNDAPISTVSLQGDTRADAMRGTYMFAIPTGTPVSRHAAARLERLRVVTSTPNMHTPAPVRLPTPPLATQSLVQLPQPSPTPESASVLTYHTNLVLLPFILPVEMLGR